MAKKCFYSFHYKPDVTRVAKIRNIGAIEDNRPAADNDWESVTRGGDAAIERWINDQLSGRTCTIVMIGQATAGRKWIDYEIRKSWNDKKGVVGIHIHNVSCLQGTTTTKGTNPFNIPLEGGKSMSDYVKVYDPPYTNSKDVYNYIAERLEGWVDEAIKIRNG